MLFFLFSFIAHIISQYSMTPHRFLLLETLYHIAYALLAYFIDIAFFFVLLDDYSIELAVAVFIFVSLSAIILFVPFVLIPYIRYRDTYKYSH